MKKILVLVFLVGTIVGLFAQESTIGVSDTTQARILLEQSKLLGQQRKFTEALYKAGQSEDIYQRVFGAQSYETVKVKNFVAAIYYSQGNYSKAIATWDSCLIELNKIFSEGHLDIAQVCNGIGRSYLLMGNAQSALEFFNKALAVLNKLFGENHLEVGRVYTNLGATYLKLDQHEKSIECYKKSLELKIKLLGELHREISETYFGIANYYANVYLLDDAIVWYKKTIDLETKLNGDNKSDLGSVFVQIGSIYKKQMKYNESMEYYKKALQNHTEFYGPDHPFLSYAYLGLGAILDNVGEYEAAINAKEKALVIIAKAYGEANSNIAAIQETIGESYLYKGDLIRALEFTNKAYALNVKVSGKNSYPSSRVLNSLGNFYYTKGDYALAQKYYEKSLAIKKQLLGENHLDLSTTYGNLGTNYLGQGLPEKAVEYYQKSLDIKLKYMAASHPEMAAFYSNLGIAYHEKGDYELAIKNHSLALDLRIKALGAQHLEVARSYNNLGACFEKQKKYELALQYYKKGLDLRQKHLGQIHPYVANSYNNIGLIYSNLAKFDTAILYLKKALTSTGYNEGKPLYKVNNINDLAAYCYQLAHIYKLSHQKDREPTSLYHAHQGFKKTIEVLDTLSFSISAPSKELLNATTTSIFADAIRVNLSLHAISDSSMYQRQSFTYAEKSKATLLLAQLKNSSILAASNNPSQLVQQEQKLRIDINWREKQRQILLDQGKSETDSSVLRISSILFDLHQKHDTLKTYFEHNKKDYHRLKYDLSTVSLDYVQDSLLLPSQTLLEYFVGDSSIYLFLVQPKNYEVIEIKKDTAFEQWIRDLTQGGIYGFYGQKGVAKGKSINNFGVAAYKLYKTLIAPVKSKLPAGEKLIIIPDGILGYIPFEALLTENPPRPDAIAAYKYLIKDHQISYCYSATLLKEMRNKIHRQRPTQKLLALAPFFLGNIDTLLSSVDSTALVVGAKDALSTLPSSGEEVALIQQTFQGQTLYGKAATMAQFQELAPQARILHLSTHGKADDRLGDYAYLAFGTPNRNGTFEKLYARDLYNLSLNADLVVLSACETGIGKLQRGEGIISMARAFAYAGAKSIVTTLWKVSDEHSKNLMSSFYKYLSKGKDKDEALRLAKLDFFKANEQRTDLLHPFFWASFIGIGDMSKL